MTHDDLILCGYYLTEEGNYLHPTSIIRDDVVRLGEGNIFHPYCVIGGSGFIRDTRQRLGRITIGNGNEFGMFSSVMIGEDGETMIGENNMFMNYVNIGHNVIIRNGNEIGAGVIIAGRTVIGSKNKIKTAAVIRNSIQIGNDNVIGMGSIVTKSIDNACMWYGIPAKRKKIVKP